MVGRMALPDGFPTCMSLTAVSVLRGALFSFASSAQRSIGTELRDKLHGSTTKESTKQLSHSSQRAFHHGRRKHQVAIQLAQRSSHHSLTGSCCANGATLQKYS